jgi:hypothetical protein
MSVSSEAGGIGGGALCTNLQAGSLCYIATRSVEPCVLGILALTLIKLGGASLEGYGSARVDQE